MEKFNNKITKATVNPKARALINLMEVTTSRVFFNVNLDMSNKTITNLAAPLSASDAVNLGYLSSFVKKGDIATSGFLNLSGGIMQGSIDMNNNPITNVPTPTFLELTNAANVEYISLLTDALNTDINECSTNLILLNLRIDKVQEDLGVTGGSPIFLLTSGGTMSGAINMGDNPIVALPIPPDTPPTVPPDSGVTIPPEILDIDKYAANVGFVNQKIADIQVVVDQTLASLTNTQSKIVIIENKLGITPGFSSEYLQVSGGTMTGNISMNNSSTIIDIKNPASNNDAMTLGYANNTYLKSSGGTLTGDLNLNNNTITNLATPSMTDLDHAANVDFVQSQLGFASVYYTLSPTTTVINLNWPFNSYFIWDSNGMVEEKSSLSDNFFSFSSDKKRLQILKTGTYLLFFEAILTNDIACNSNLVASFATGGTKILSISSNTATGNSIGHTGLVTINSNSSTNNYIFIDISSSVTLRNYTFQITRIS